jgi:hypothetical protein
LLAGEKGIRLSLAGAQKKLPVYYDEQNYYLGLGSAPSNYIIKPPCNAPTSALDLDVDFPKNLQVVS